MLKRDRRLMLRLFQKSSLLIALVATTLLGGVVPSVLQAQSQPSYSCNRICVERMARKYYRMLYEQKLRKRQQPSPPAYYRLRFSVGGSSGKVTETTTAGLQISRNWIGLGQTVLKLKAKTQTKKYDVNIVFNDLFLVFGRDYSLTLGMGQLSKGTLTVSLTDTSYEAQQASGSATFGMLGIRTSEHTEWLLGLRRNEMVFSQLERASLVTGEIVTLDQKLNFNATQITVSLGYSVLW
jgi:hypothetical protein